MTHKSDESFDLIKIKERSYQKLTYFKEFYELTKQLQIVIENNDVNNINNLLEARQNLIKLIDQINSKDANIRATKDKRPDAETQTLINMPATDIPGELVELENEIRLYIENICAIDKSIKNILEESFRNTIKSINQLQTAWHTEATYRKKARQVQGFFVNKKR